MSYDRINLAFRFGDVTHHFYDLYAKEDYNGAAWFLWMVNHHLPNDAILEDLPEPQVSENGYFDELTGDEQYRDYCRHWGAKVMQAIANYEDTKQRQFYQNSGYSTEW